MMQDLPTIQLIHLLTHCMYVVQVFDQTLQKNILVLISVKGPHSKLDEEFS